jgi:hypothetical protein
MIAKTLFSFIIAPAAPTPGLPFLAPTFEVAAAPQFLEMFYRPSLAVYA